MFGPNSIFKYTTNINYSHREEKFFNLFFETQEKFKYKFNLMDYDILFIPGSGTVGIESLFFSSINTINVIKNPGKFHDRWSQMAQIYSGRKINLTYPNLYCQLETSLSTFYRKGNCFVDCISSVPYLNIPQNTEVFVTASNKQLGSYPGLAIVGVRKDCWRMFKDDSDMSYLNLKRYKKYSDTRQSPSTFPIHILDHLNYNLDSFDLDKLRLKINRISEKIINVVGSDNVIGEHNCPVITIKKKIIPDSIAKQFSLYGLYMDSEHYQIFTYSELEHEYNNFLQCLSKEI